MDFLLNVIWRFSLKYNKKMTAGQKTLKQIHRLIVKTTAKYEGVPHALTHEEIVPVKAICDQLVVANFHLKVPDTGSKRPKHVYYQHVYEDKVVSMGIFILPPGVSIPLHDHPRMSVISRVLYGSMHVKSYDFVKSGALHSGKKRMGRLCVDKVATAPYTTELLPDCGNLHELIGGDDIGCAFLDIITPPYNTTDGRDCTYFRVINSIPSSQDANEKLFVFESYEPQDFAVIVEEYHGPSLQHDVC